MKNLIGSRFGRLLVLRQNGKDIGRHLLWECRCDCGKHITTSGNRLKRGTCRSCGCLKTELAKQIVAKNCHRTGPDHHNWSGGKATSKQGYVYVSKWTAKRMCPFGNWKTRVPEHRVIMTLHLGRMIHDDETIHHRNGIRHDNRIENLELKVSNHGKGQSIPDIVSWAETILKRYKPESLSQ